MLLLTERLYDQVGGHALEAALSLAPILRGLRRDSRHWLESAIVATNDGIASDLVISLPGRRGKDVAEVHLSSHGHPRVMKTS